MLPHITHHLACFSLFCIVASYVVIVLAAGYYFVAVSSLLAIDTVNVEWLSIAFSLNYTHSLYISMHICYCVVLENPP